MALLSDSSLCRTHTAFHHPCHFCAKWKSFRLIKLQSPEINPGTADSSIAFIAEFLNHQDVDSKV
jgi:hypothetical protein